MDNNVTYSMSGNLVVIHQPYHEDFYKNEDGLRDAIANVKERRSTYATEEAYQRHLDMFNNALGYLLVHQDGVY
jgi:hypothetical protein